MPVRDFATRRLEARDWAPALADAARRRSLEAALAEILTPRVLRRLPEPLHLSDTGGDVGADVSAWVSSRAAEGDVFQVFETASGDLIGLLLLSPADRSSALPTRHVGYLFAEAAWGKGYATELVSGLISTVRADGPSVLAAGVGAGNAASARVLEKAGFRRRPDLSRPDADVFVIEVG